MTPVQKFARVVFYISGFILILLLLLKAISQADTYLCGVESHFTPAENMDVLISNELDYAKHNVYLSLFGESNELLTETLINLKHKGIDIRLAVDKRQAELPSSHIPRLEKAGIKVVRKKTNALEHNKFALIDTYYKGDNAVVLPTAEVISGSWNWSKSANYQDNSDTFFHCAQASILYLQEFTAIWNRDNQSVQTFGQ